MTVLALIPVVVMLNWPAKLVDRLPEAVSTSVPTKPQTAGRRARSRVPLVRMVAGRLGMRAASKVPEVTLLAGKAGTPARGRTL